MNDFKIGIKDRYPLIDFALYGSRARRNMRPNVLIGDYCALPLFKDGDILDANAIFNLIKCTRWKEWDSIEKIDTHISDETIHVTQEDKDKWNNYELIQSDWNESDEESYAFIKNKPFIPVALADLQDDSTHRVVTDDQISTWGGKQDAISDLDTIRSGAAAGTTALQPSALNDYYNKTSVDNKLLDKQDVISDLNTIRSGALAGATAYQKPASGIPSTDLSSDVQTSLGKADTALQEHQDISGKVDVSDVGVANGIAQLDVNGKVPSQQLPSYVDDVLEYTSVSLFPVTGETGKIYVDTTTNKTYRWGGSTYTEISESLALGETSSTAYAGDKGKSVTDNFNTHAANTDIHITASERTAWNAKADASNVYTKAQSDANYIPSSTTISTINNNGHEYVDLGLPSGTLWATMNVGASSESEYGNYYQYGKGADDYSITSSQPSYSGTEIPLDLSVDTARQVWGGDWHMPTYALMQELRDNTRYVRISIGGGRYNIKLESITDSSKYIILSLPGSKFNGGSRDVGTCGYYLTSTLYDSNLPYFLSINDNYTKSIVGYNSLVAGSVRPVIEPTQTTIAQYGATQAEKTTWNNKSDFSGDYDDLTNKPTIPAAQILSDWNQSDNTLADYIKNKPTSDVVVAYYHGGKFYESFIERAGHDYIEINGIKWATVDIGADSPTDAGLYFQWGDTQGYTDSLVGSGSGLKAFGWADYKYTNDGGNTFTKYNSTDQLTLLQTSDDAATVAWGPEWRIPTLIEANTLFEDSTTEWSSDYNNSGAAGVICTVGTLLIFFRVCGTAKDGTILVSNTYIKRWISDIYPDSLYIAQSSQAYHITTNEDNVQYYTPQGINPWLSLGAWRQCGFFVRAIYTGTKPSGVSGYDGEITPSEGKIYIDKNTNKQYRWDGTAYVELTAPLVNADWNAASGVALILNKPTIPSIWIGTLALYDAIVTKDQDTIYIIKENS